MKLSNYAFIMMGEGYTPSQKAIVSSNAFSTTVVCVENIGMACEEAKKLAVEKVELIELCGAFKGDMIDAVINAVDGKIPVGSVSMRDEERAKFLSFISQ